MNLDVEHSWRRTEAEAPVRVTVIPERNSDDLPEAVLVEMPGGAGRTLG